MTADVLIEWTKTDGDVGETVGAVPDVTVFANGRLRVGPRLGEGEVRWLELAPDALEELRRFLFVDQRVMEIHTEGLRRLVVAAAAQHRKAIDTSVAILTDAPQRDASTSVFRVAEADRRHEVRYYDLFGDAERYSEVEELQRLRRIELRMLQIVEELEAQ